MKKIEELVRRRCRGDGGVCGEFRLTDLSILTELQILDFRSYALQDRVALLFDTRNALEVDEGNCALIIGFGSSALSWSRTERRDDFTALSFMGGEVFLEGPGLRFEMSFTSMAELNFVVESAEFFTLDGIGIPEIPPDYTEADSGEIIAGVPAWDTHCEVLSEYAWAL